VDEETTDEEIIQAVTTGTKSLTSFKELSNEKLNEVE
jgi:hypothetical protein